MNFSNWLKNKLHQRNLKASQLSYYSGVSESEISRLLSGKKPSAETIKRISPPLKVAPDEPLRIAGFLPPEPPKPETIRIPMLGKVPANDIKLVWDDVFDWYEINWDLVKTKNAFILEISGNCLVDEGIHNGDLIIVSKDFDFENGKIYVVRVDGQTSCKKVFKQDHTVILQRANRDMPDPITVDPKRQEFEIIGRVIKSIRSH